MKLVKEHINFQRGLDPRDAMSTGDVQKRKLDKIYRAVSELASAVGVNSPGHVLRDDQACLSQFEYKDYIYMIGLNPNSNPNSNTMELWNYSASYEELASDKSRNRKLEYEQEEFDALKEAIETVKEWLEYRSNTINFYNRHFNESNFKRGLDPRDAMSIGDVQKRETDRILKEMRRYMRAAMKLYAPHQKLKSKDFIDKIESDLNYKSYYFKIDKYQFQLKYYYNRPLWDLEFNYYGFKRYVQFQHTTLKDFIKEVRMAMQDLDLR